MAKLKLEQLKALSPLAAAIAFSAVLPQQALAATHLIESQEDLDNAIEDINDTWEEEGSSHTITFDSSLSGEHLILNQIRLYEDDTLVIDGAGAKDLELGALERGNTFGITLSGEGEGASTLTIKNVNILEGGNADNGYIISGYGDSHITLDKVNISGASIGDGDGEGVIEAEGISIKDSSFSGLTGRSILRFDDWAYTDEEQNISITNTSFTNNYTEKYIIDFDINGYGTETTNVTIAGVSFDGNETTSKYGYGAILNIDVYARYLTDQFVNVTITNTSFTNNKSENIVDLESRSFERATRDATLNVDIANMTVANNVTDGSAINVFAYDNDSSEGEGFSSLTFNMAHATIVNNGGDIESYGEFFGGAGFEAEGSGDLIAENVSLNIVNSIISGNTVIQGSKGKGRFEGPSYEELEIVDADVYSNFELLIESSLVGVEKSGHIIKENSVFGVDPMLGELELDADTGTMFMKPQTGSPAINAATDNYDADVAAMLGVATDELIDQLGNKRTTGSASDMGAVEVGSKKSSSSGLFGSFGLASVFAGFGLLAVRRKRK